jgi:peptide deformylase
MFEKALSGPLFLMLTMSLTLVGPSLASAQDTRCSQILGGIDRNLKPQLVSKDHEALRKVSREVTRNEILSPDFSRLIEDLRSEMKRKGGIGIAAPQLGFNLRVIVARQPELLKSSEHILVNPKLTPLTSDTAWGIEGCLSVPGVCGFVKRFKKIRVEYHDLTGSRRVLEAEGDFARILQHEVDHLNGILYTDKSLLEVTQQKAALLKTREKAPAHIQRLTEMIDSAVEESFDPYSLSYDVRLQSSNELSFKLEIEGLLQAALDTQDSQTRSQEFSNWVRSEDHALFLYDLLSKTGLSHFREELDYLSRNNVYFVESHRTEGGGFITYSFEKEGTRADISLLYRPPQFSEDQWLARPEAERFELLKKARIPKKTFTKASEIMPTGLKPSSVGGYSVELSDHLRKGYGWEISHKKYEINRQRLMREIRELAGIFKETHSFQVHLVFELPKKYPKYQEFIYWYKHLNDYLYLKGLEEGLHGNYLTGVANLASDMSWGERIKNWLRSSYTTSKIVLEAQSRLGRQNSKFFSVGLRAGLYGPPSHSENMKIGLELRDSTRKIDLLDRYTEQISRSLEAKIWEKSESKDISNRTLRLTTDRPTSTKAMSSIVSHEYAKLFAEIEPTSYFPLLKFDETLWFDYREKIWKRVPSPTQTRIQKARAVYEQDLRDLEKELRGLESRGEKTEPEIIRIALRMSLATWAKSARVAELFERF